MLRRQFLQGLAVLALSATLASAQLSLRGVGGGNVTGSGGASGSGGGGSCTPNGAYTAFDTRVNAARGSNLSGSDATNYCNLFNSLASASLINGSTGTSTVFDGLWVFAAPDSPTALLNLIANGSFDATLNAGGASNPTFSAYNGFTTDGTNNFVDTNLNPFAGGLNYVLNSAAWSLWSLTAGQTTLTSGATNGTSAGITALNPRNTADNIRFTSNFNFSVAFENGGANTDGTGFYTVDRTANTTTTIYKNASSTGTTATAATDVPGATFLFGGAGISRNARQFAAGAIGAGRTGTQETNFYNALRTYMTAVGVP